MMAADKLYVEKTAAFSKANNDLAFRLYQLLSKDEGNLVFSPFGISSALTMLHQGARKECAKEIERVLGFEDALSSFQGILQGLKGKDAFDSANALLTNTSFTIQEDYKKAVQEVFQAMISNADFENDTSGVASRINEWVKGKTGNGIEKMIDSFDPKTTMAVLNAACFKKPWLKPFFEECSSPSVFYRGGLFSVGDPSAKKVIMMTVREYFHFVQKKTFSAVCIPFSGNLSMMLLLPYTSDGLPDLETKLSSSTLTELRKEMTREELVICLPRFSLEGKNSLSKALQSMGASAMFREGADLGRICDSDKLKVSEFVHKAVVEVNEDGTGEIDDEIQMKCASCSPNPESMIADHPFLFYIFDTRNDLILFMGRADNLS